jgi:predicted homoserine dehydrogenase-like protein
VILVDRALQKRHDEGRPVRVGLVGAGYQGRMVARQIEVSTPGMEISAIWNRHPDKALSVWADCGVSEPRSVGTGAELDDAIRRGERALAEGPQALLDAEQIDAIVEVTGTVDFGAGIALGAFERGKHVLTMNAELGGTLGPLLKHRADRAGVVFSDADGDQPAVILNLYRFVRGIGLRPLLCGNIKGLQDHTRTPETQAEYARRWDQKPEKVTSFADGTKISFEQALVANATGMTIAKRGMYGFDVPGQYVDQAANWFPMDEIARGPGIVDYVVGAVPSPGVFVIGLETDAVQRRFLDLYKMGPGPYYTFHTPYHLCHLEVPISIVRAVIFDDAAVTPDGGPRVDVVATAKRSLEQGNLIDGIGGFDTYGQCERYDVTRREGLLPIGLAEGARLVRDVPRDEVVRLSDVELPPDRLCDVLRKEQDVLFPIDERDLPGGAHGMDSRV